MLEDIPYEIIKKTRMTVNNTSINLKSINQDKER